MPDSVNHKWYRFKIASLREHARHLIFHRERQQQFRQVAKAVNRKRVFLVGNGPSLNDHDLDLLLNEDYFLCNHAENISWTQGKRHPFYIATDHRVPGGFVDGAPKLEAKTYFFDETLKPMLSPAFTARTDVIWFPRAKGGAVKRGISKKPWIGVAGGQTVLLSAAQLAIFLGYREIYIIGCDLNYRASKAYAYDAPEKNFEKAIRDEEKMILNTNAGFKRLHDETKIHGISIANAGIDGNLKSIQRVDFEGLFK